MATVDVSGTTLAAWSPSPARKYLTHPSSIQREEPSCPQRRFSPTPLAPSASYASELSQQEKCN
jgi:hypothetical protein